MRTAFQADYERGFGLAGAFQFDVAATASQMYRYAKWRKAKLAGELAATLEGYADGLIFLATLNKMKVEDI